MPSPTPTAINPSPKSTPDEPNDQGSVPPWAFAIFAPLAFLAGRVISGIPGHLGPLGDPSGGPLFVKMADSEVQLDLSEMTLDEIAERPGITVRTLGTPDSREAEIAHPVRRASKPAIKVQDCLMILLATAVVALGYEYHGVVNGNDPWPLTFFVRCINNSASIPTFITTLSLAFVFGMWFWFPTKDDQSLLALWHAKGRLLDEAREWARGED